MGCYTRTFPISWVRTKRWHATHMWWSRYKSSVLIAGLISDNVMLLVVTWEKYQDKCAWVTKQNFPPLVNSTLGQMTTFSESCAKMNLALVALGRLYEQRQLPGWKGNQFIFLLQCWVRLIMDWLNLAREPKNRSRVLYLDMSSLEESISFCFGCSYTRNLTQGLCTYSRGSWFTRDWVVFSQVSEFSRNWVSS